MSHFAKVVDRKVVQVIVAEPDFFTTFQDTSPGTWVQTSYNTRGNKHLLGGTPVRANYAGIGYTYDPIKDVFYEPQPFPSWTLNEETWMWDAPALRPDDNQAYLWDENTLTWVKEF